MKHHAIREWLIRNTPVEPALLAGGAFDHLVDERVRVSRTQTAEAYFDHLQTTPSEVETLIAGVAVPETWFLRYPQSFDALFDHVSDVRGRRDERHTLRMLSAACAAGQEPCSMAMTALRAGWPADRVAVDAIDISRDALAEAHRNAYGGRAAREAFPDWALPWLTRSENILHVNAEVTGTINYVHDDVITTNRLGGPQVYDVIFCRNLIIYLNQDARERLISRFVDWLQPDGLLFVGHAEQATVPRHVFEAIPRPHAFALRRVTAPLPEPPRLPAPRPPVPARPVPRPVRAAIRPNNRPTQPTVTSDATPRPDARPADTDTLLAARAMADRGELEQARRVAEKVLCTNRADVSALELLGSVNLAMGRVAEARDWLRKAIYLAPDRENALLQLALISEQMGYPHQARRYRDRAARAHRNTVVGDTRNDE